MSNFYLYIFINGIIPVFLYERIIIIKELENNFYFSITIEDLSIVLKKVFWKNNQIIIKYNRYNQVIGRN